MESHYYQVDLTWKKERIGEISSPELNTVIDVATPPQFPKGVDGIWSPEHLLTAAVNSCFMTTFLAIAENSKLEFSSFICTAKGKLEQVDGKMSITEVLLEPILTIYDSNLKDKALKLLQKSESICLISNSINSKVILNPQIKY